jgi:DNA-directed RNA polymerase specialized sigma subunit
MNFSEKEYLVKYKPIINKLVIKFHRKYYIEKEELQSIANLAFWEAYRRYYKKNNFIIIMKKVITNYFFNEIKSRIGAQKIKEKIEDNYTEKNDYIYLDIKYNFSVDVQKIINIIKFKSKKLLDKKDKITQRKIAKYLRSLNWDCKKIGLAFKEIKLSLKELNYGRV